MKSQMLITIFILTCSYIYGQDLKLYDAYSLKRVSETPIEESLTHYENVLKNNPKLPNAYSERGFIRLVMKDFKNSLSDFELSIKYKNNDNISYLFIALIYSIQHDHQNAIKYFELAKANTNDNLKYLMYYTVYNIYFENLDLGCRDLIILNDNGIRLIDELENKCKN